MSEFDGFIETVKEGAKELAKELFNDYQGEAKGDAQMFLDKAKEDLKRWTKLLAQGDLSEQDFSDLIYAKKALAEIHLLRQKGIALSKLERFRSGLMDLVIDTAFDVFL